MGRDHLQYYIDFINEKKKQWNQRDMARKFQSHSLTLSIFAQGSFLLPLGYIALPEETASECPLCVQSHLRCLGLFLCLDHTELLVAC